MNEYITNLHDVKAAYVYENPATAYDLELRSLRERAFDRMIREIQDEAYEDGYNDRAAFEDEMKEYG